MAYIKSYWPYFILISLAAISAYLSYNISLTLQLQKENIETLTVGSNYVRQLINLLEPDLRPFLNIAASLILLFLTYKITTESVGRLWALLPVFLMVGETYFSKFIASSDGEIIAAIISLYTIYFIIKSINHRSKKRFVYAGLVTGIATAFAFENLMLLPALVAASLISFSITSYNEWANIDPTMRSGHFKIRVNYFIKSLSTAIGVSLLVLYLIYFISGNTEINSSSTIINWLNNNFALRPIGLYIESYIKYFSLPWGENNHPIFAEPIALIGFILISILMAVYRSAKSFIQSMKYRTTPVLDYLSANSYDFSLFLTTSLLALISIKNYAGKEFLMLIIMPQLLCLTTISVKRWFLMEDYGLKRNFVLNLQIFAKNIIALSIKSLILLSFIVLYALIILNN